jgi:hypothetical protein
MNNQPPPTIGTDRVLEYAIISSDTSFTGNSPIYVDGKPLGSVPRLAICEEFGRSSVLLYYCDRDWSPLGVSAANSVDEARRRAESAYSGLAGNWLSPPHTEKGANEFRDRKFENNECTFCKRVMSDVNLMISNENDTAFICNICIDAFYQRLHS